MKISVVTPSLRPQGLEIVRQSLLKQSLKDFEWLVEINTSGEPDFNASMNRMIQRARGDLIVSLQDYIKIPEDGLQKFWDAYYNGAEFMTAPVGHCETEEYKDPKWDWRVHTDKCESSAWEIDWGAAPRHLLLETEFDERLDGSFGFDNVIVGKKAEKLGFNFSCLPDNKVLGFNHVRGEEHEFNDKRDPDMAQYVLRKIEMDCQ